MIVMDTPCIVERFYHYLCEFETSEVSTKSFATKRTLIKLPQIQNTTLSAHFIFCPAGHTTHKFLACDLKSDCWANDDVSLMMTSPDTWLVPPSSWCDVSSTTDAPFFVCTSRTEHVPFTLVCDHHEDCFDGSDEDFCDYLPCPIDKPVPCGTMGQVCV